MSPARGDEGPGHPALLAALAVVAGALAAAAPLRSYDLFWHLATGNRILSLGTVPRTDPFSFTAAGTPWVDHSWLFQVLLAGVWAAAGTWGPWLLKVLAGSLLAVLLWLHLRRWRVPAAAAMALLLVALAGVRFRLMFRPELASLLLAGLTAWLLCPGTGGGSSKSAGRRLWPLVPLAVVWINLHGGAVLMPMMVGAAAVGSWAGRWQGSYPAGRGPGPWALLPWVPATAAALLVNPYGYRVLEVPFRLTSIVARDWAGNPEWAWPDPRLFPLLYLSVGGLVVAGALLRHRVEPISFALGLLGAALALRYARNVGVFFVLLPFAAAPLLAGSRRWASVRPRLAVLLGAAGCLWVGWVPGWLALGPETHAPQPGLEPGRYPVAACDFLAREHLDGRRFNEVAFGGYLIWRFPGTPVFIDGRNEIYPELLEEIHEGLNDVQRFWDLTSRWQIDVAVLRYPPHGVTVLYPASDGSRRAVARSWSEVYFPSAAWALVYWDDTAMIRVRRRGTDPDWVAAHEYHLNPDDWPFLAGEVEAGKADARDLLGEVRRKLAADPGCRRARELESALARMSRAAPALAPP